MINFIKRFDFSFLRKSCALVIVSVVLMACQPKQELVIKAADEVRWRSDNQFFTHNQSLLNLNQGWTYQAKIGIKSRTLNEQARLAWQHKQQYDSLRLFGPLGIGTIKLDFDNNGAQLSDNKGRIFYGESATQLLSDIIGWPLPIDALASWLLMQPEVNADYQYRLNSEGQIVSLRQFGWQIDYQDYRLYDDKLLPRRVTAFKQFQASEQGEVIVKMVTKLWQWDDLSSD